MAFVPVQPAVFEACSHSTLPLQSQWRRDAWSLPRQHVRRLRSRRQVMKMGTGEPKEKEQAKDFQDEEDRRLQADKRYVFREFTKLVISASCIGLVLFFYDILTSLMVVSIGAVYAVAVLLEVRGADSLLSRMVGGVVGVWKGVVHGVREGYRVVRREVRKGLED